MTTSDVNSVFEQHPFFFFFEQWNYCVIMLKQFPDFLVGVFLTHTYMCVSCVRVCVCVTMCASSSVSFA